MLGWDRRHRAAIFGWIYIPDVEPDGVFVITAYELSGKALAAYRKRREKKQQ